MLLRLRYAGPGPVLWRYFNQLGNRDCSRTGDGRLTNGIPYPFFHDSSRSRRKEMKYHKNNARTAQNSSERRTHSTGAATKTVPLTAAAAGTLRAYYCRDAPRWMAGAAVVVGWSVSQHVYVADAPILLLCEYYINYYWAHTINVSINVIIIG